MMIEGAHTFTAGREEVWKLLLDPEVIGKTMPGATEMKLVGEGKYNGKIKVGIGAITAAEFDVNITLIDVFTPERYTMEIDGRGTLGFTRGSALVELLHATPGPGTLLHYKAEMQVGGKVAAVGQRLLDSVSRMMARQGLEALSAELERRLAGERFVKPAGFTYLRPTTLEEALAALADPDAKPLAGGQSLIPAMNFRLAQPGRLVDLNAVASLAGITATPEGGLRIGAMTRHRAVETSPLVAARAPLLAEAMPYIAHAPIRNRGTIGGSLAHADPAAELPAVMLALEASVELRRGSGSRRLPVGEFFTGLFATALESGELVTAIELPPPAARGGWAFEEMARRSGDFALVGVAVTVSRNQQRQCSGARVVLLSIGEGPVLAVSVAAAMEGREGTPDQILAAAAAVQDDIDPPSDIHASAAYRRQLAQVLTGRALTRALQRTEAR